MVAGVPPSSPSTPFTVSPLTVSLRRLDIELHAGGCNKHTFFLNSLHKQTNARVRLIRGRFCLRFFLCFVLFLFSTVEKKFSKLGELSDDLFILPCCCILHRVSRTIWRCIDSRRSLYKGTCAPGNRPLPPFYPRCTWILPWFHRRPGICNNDPSLFKIRIFSFLSLSLSSIISKDPKFIETRAYRWQWREMTVNQEREILFSFFLSLRINSLNMLYTRIRNLFNSRRGVMEKNRVVPLLFYLFPRREGSVSIFNQLIGKNIKGGE